MDMEQLFVLREGRKRVDSDRSRRLGISKQIDLTNQRPQAQNRHLGHAHPKVRIQFMSKLKPWPPSKAVPHAQERLELVGFGGRKHTRADAVRKTIRLN